MGSILLTQDGAETSNISEDKRGNSLSEFYDMLDCACRSGDRFFMTKEAYEHEYSYGDYYPAFSKYSWDEFQRIPSLAGIDFFTYNKITGAFQQVYPEAITSKMEIDTKAEPRGEGGFAHDNMPDGFICNLTHWNAWHRDYLTANPNKIIWEQQDFLPNQSAIDSILSGEIDHYIKSHLFTELELGKDIHALKFSLCSKAEFHEKGNINKPLKKNVNTLLFHSVVMARIAAGDKISYCIEVANKICKENYYIHEPELSLAEQRACGSKRHIYSIVKYNRKQYISIDFEKGMFEFHNHRGEHLGEYHFDGTMNAPAQVSHNFKTIHYAQWR